MAPTWRPAVAGESLGHAIAHHIVAVAIASFGLAGTGIIRAVQAPDPYRLVLPSGLDMYMPVPADNPLSKAKIELGRRLFFDASLSADGTVRCATCHDPARAFTDGRARAEGAFGRTGPRSTPSLFNVAWTRRLFWDGRETRLETQVLRPIANPVEMGASVGDVVDRLSRSAAYAPAFQAAFGTRVSADNLGLALASYVRTLVSGDAPVDRYYAGDVSAISAAARRGYEVFAGPAGCSTCHVGPLFTDDGFHNTGVSWGGGDTGRFAVTGSDEDRGQFNTPSLRNIERTAPYMHDGSLTTLEAVVDFYDRGGTPNPCLDDVMRPRHLSAAEKRDLIEFLRALTSR